jgi:lipoprotein NlpD
MSRTRDAMALLLAISAGLLAGACANPGRPPVVERSPVFAARPEHYLVQAGDTLYSIAWRFELDFTGLGRANGLREPYTIYPGQKLRMKVQLAGATVRQAPAVSKSEPAASKKPVASTAKPGAYPAKLRWSWPVSAAVARDYGSSSKGMDYRLKAGDRVRAAAAGEVVYAGNGLGGYEHLVIIKHSEHFLSAYSLNTTSGVREGQRIKASAKLADIPLRGRDALVMHFEIRKDGEAVDPKAVIGQ